jgi:uncharacterized protein
MFGRLPEKIDPIQLAEQGAHLTGELALREMTRLASLCEVDEEAVTADLHFTQTPHGLRFLRATIEARLGLVCQRCLRPMEVVVRSEPVLALFRPGEPQAGVPEDAEPLVVEPGWSLADLVEDELLLALPMMPRHAVGECAADTHPPRVQPPAKVMTEKPHPFAVLEKLRKRD